MGMEREPTSGVHQRAAARAALLVEGGPHLAVRPVVEGGHRTDQPGQFGKAVPLQARERPDAPVGRDDQVALDKLPAGRADVQVLATQQDLPLVERPRVEAEDAIHGSLSPALTSRRRIPEGIGVFGPTYRRAGSYRNTGSA
jgi:hypothetical protein